MNISRSRIVSLVASLALAASASTAGADPSNVPLYLKQSVNPNVLLNMSVETPMGGAAYADQNGQPTASCTGRVNFDSDGNGSTESYGACYFPTHSYLGYFDPVKCYDYDSGNARFNPVAAGTATYPDDLSCNGRWSGNFLNWASMTAIDMFIRTMTGGNRVSDTTSLTVIQRARKHNNDSWFPYKLVRASNNVAPSTVTPFSNSYIIVYNTTWGFKVSTTTRANASAAATTEYTGRVRVCNVSAGLEGNCVGYASSAYYKPEGLIQEHKERMRFALTSYTTDTDQARGGGVLRSNAKYVGPRMLDASGNWVDNPRKEWGTDGLFVNNPEGVAGGLNSGVVNYVNKFSDAAYKTYDPIGELMYETVRYFKHLGPTPEYSSGITRNTSDSRCGGFWFANSAAEWEDPYQYPCQRGFIIGINDANPWLDKKLPGTYFTASTLSGAGGATYSLIGSDYGEPSNADPQINVRTLTNTVGQLEGLNGTTWSSSGTWTSTGASGSVSGTNDSVGGGFGTFDNACTSKTVAQLGEVMGTCPSPGKQNSYYIAGLAHYANITDLRGDLENDQKVSSFFIDTQEYQSNPLDGPRNMLWLAGKYGGFIDENGNNAPDLAEEWDADGDGSPDNYVLATQPARLVAGLRAAFDDVLSRTSSATTLVATSGQITSDLLLYQAKFDSSNWTGQLLAYELNSDATVANTVWDTDDVGSIPGPASRQIYSWNPVPPSPGVAPSGSQFLWTGSDPLNTAQKAALNDNSAILDYLRGVQSNEKTPSNPSGTFRPRAKLLGDIIHSSPLYVGAQQFGYEVLDPADGGGNTYKTFRLGNASRTGMVYVGGNDSMLHGFNGDTGTEMFAFVPNAAFSNGLSTLSNLNYAHRGFVDGPLSFGDAYWGGSWKTVLVGSMGGGGQSLFALDITDPGAITGAGGTSRILWELDSSVASDLGYLLQKPVVARMQNGRFAAIFGNGYNSSGGLAKLFIVYLDPDLTDGWTLGTDYLLLDTSSVTGNGLSEVALLADSRKTVTTIYAGDLQGNLWKFDVNDADPSNWSVAYTPGGVNQPLFSAVDPDGNAQPITAPLEIGLHSRGGYMLYFGTGKYYEDGDQTNTQVQSFYGIWDVPADTAITDARTTALQEIQILEEVPSQNARVTSTVPGGTDIYGGATPKRGWFMDLKVVGGPAKGERVFSAPILAARRVIFASSEPSTNPCEAGGNSWITQLDALTGGRPATTVFDLNGDDKFDNADKVTLADGSDVVPSGVSVDGVLPGLILLTGGSSADAPPQQTGHLVTNNSFAELLNKKILLNGYPRASWRELR